MRNKFRMAWRVDLPWTYQRTIKWMGNNLPGSLIFAPVVFPVIFALMFYEQYRIQFVMDALNNLNRSLQFIEGRNVTATTRH